MPIMDYIIPKCKNIYMILAKKLRELRKECGLSQQSVADAIGTSRRLLSFYEVGTLQVPNELIPILAKYYEVTTDYLFGLED